ncbi:MULTISPECIES: tRNA pseudouridine(55) synthase TruB [Marinobacter]|uniref:tRNA pseudouridine synthase B n=2 Tax=Marinobacter TaxID=2742 RepID=A0A844HUP4_9GAMM|nr:MULTISPECIES: tRNA pseudouridine(55) synthase TruB [Marinobacter]MBO6811955.1 tRNA pseudouridine(55) synthase TruB [Marinobacter sp.]MBO6875310.1 tRNA pseudouridine(55) synthase TruB [Marinobacter sp.]MTI97862.1 tRNA pseudouridine(55) synthase TruB [Marinobacter adhaerens]QTN43115.1 tRNA pseudouridine(55) synthase TruB [Marinobacter salsuginis]
MSRRRKGRDVNGILVIDKPQGVTSNGILQQVKRLFGAAKAGHTGALDPLATGVLPLCFGEATKFSQMMLDSDKAYIATARLGIRTETGDSEGAVVAEKPVPDGLTADLLEPVLDGFRGDIQQVPSMYSALKHKGRPLYEYAREGIEVERPARPVTIYELTLLDIRENELDIAVSCTKGTYIRSLVEDIGEALGCGAHVTALRRTMASGFTLANAHAVSDLEAMRERGESLDGLLVAPDAALSMFPEHRLAGQALVSILNGQPVRIPGQAYEGFVRLYANESANESFVGLAEAFPEGEQTNLVPRRLVKNSGKR